jgi:hypothetical protein
LASGAIGDDQPNFLRGPVSAFFWSFVHVALLDHSEADPPQHEVGLTRSFTAAELAWLQDPADAVAAGKTNHGLRCVSLVGVDKFVAGRLAEWMLGACVQIGYRLQDVFSGEARWDGRGHGGGPGAERGDGRQERPKFRRQLRECQHTASYEP